MTTNRHTSLFVVFVALGLILQTCAAPQPARTVSRVAADQATDFSGRWNETDARLVAEEMITDVVNRPWLGNFRELTSRKPVMIVGRIRNETQDHIDTDVFTKDLERELINSGEVTFVASADEREQILAERADQQSYSSFDTAKRLAQEVGADFMLIGNISQVIDSAPNRREQSIFYSVNLELINVETNEKAWLGNKKIKKLVNQKRLNR